MTVNPRLNPSTTGSSSMVQQQNEEAEEVPATQEPEEVAPESSPSEKKSTEKLDKHFQEMQVTDSGIAVEHEEIDTSFPMDLLLKLDDMVNKPKWIIPVLPKHELELLLDASIRLARLGIDTKNEACQRFIKEGLTISFNKILLDDAVSTWKFEIHKYIFKNTEKLLELCVLKLEDDCFPLLDLLAIAFNPNSRFHSYNASRSADSNGLPQSSNGEEKPPYAKTLDHRQPKGWLVNLVNHFGNLGGFGKLRKRFCDNGNLNVPVVCALIRPFGYCAEILVEKTIEDYLVPIIHVIKSFLDSITDEVLKKESKTESKNEAITMIIKSMKSIIARLPGQEEFCKELEKLRLQMILRLLQVSPFNGKMNALNEINRVISSVSYHSHHHRHAGYDEDEYLTHDMVAKWLQENQVLVIVLKDNLHQPQYVEKLEKIIRFAVKTKTLTIEDLDTIWMAQIGKHEAIVKNVHDLLAKLAWDFSAEQLDTLFSRFQASWNTANKKQQEKLLELIRRLAEDDKEGVIAHKVLMLLWQLAHSDDLPTDIMDQALNAHIKILDYSCSQTQDRDALKVQWINCCVDELRSGKWVIPALKSIKAICELFYEGCSTINNPHVIYRNTIVENIQQSHAVVSLVAEDLTNYMNNIRKIYEDDPLIDPLKLQPDGRYSHVMQITERLDFLRFILNDGKMWLCQPQAEQIWICLAINSVFPVDKDVCFNWFSTVMGDDPDLDPEITRHFFEQNVLKIQPETLNEAGLRCFERFFKYVNMKEGHLQKKRNGTFILENTDLIGYNYLWRVIIESSSDIAHHGIEILKEIYTNLGHNLKLQQNEIHEIFIKTCIEKFRPSEEILKNTDENIPKTKVLEEARKIMLCLKALKEYVAESDCNYMEEKAFPPHSKACRGRQICLYVRFSSQNRQLEDFEIWTHTNESIAMLRRKICHKLKSSSQQIKLDIYNNSELINPADDRKLVGDLEIKDRTLFTVKIGSIGGSVPSSPDSSSDSSPPPTPQQSSGPNIEKEQMLPGVILSRKKFASKLFSLGELAMKYEVYDLRNIILSLLNICPTDIDTTQQLKMACQHRAHKGSQSKFSLESFYFGVSPLQVLYNLEVTYLLLLPAVEMMSNSPLGFQQDFVLAGGIECLLNMYKEKTFLQGSDALTKRCAYTVLLKTSKFLFTTIAFAHISVIAEALQKDNAQEIAAFQERHSYALTLQQAIQQIPHHYYENIIRSHALKLGQSLNKHAIKYMPCQEVVTVILKICWSAGIGDVTLHQESYETIHSRYEMDYFRPLDIEDSNLSKEAFEVLTITLALCPTISESIIRDKFWKMFILDTLLSSNRLVRLTATDQFFLIVSKCSNGQLPLKFFIQLLFAVRDRNVLQHPHQASEYFNLLCRLLNYGRSTDLQLRNASSILEQEIKWLKNLEEKYLQQSINTADLVVPELLEGHLGVTKELLSYHSIQKRYMIGCDPNGDQLLSSLLNNFVFSASKLAVVTDTSGECVTQNVNPICTTSACMVGVLDLLVALATNCVQNFKMLSDYLITLYYSNSDSSLTDWEYQPPIGPRPNNGFVGLKNAGATCYMNSVLQQLYMIPEVRCGVLSSDIDYSDDSIEEDEKNSKDFSISKEDEAVNSKERVEKNQEEERKQYSIKILSQVQAIFGHLHSSKLQFHVPKGFWRSFRLFGEPVNVREQHDAYEFFNTLVDNIDEGLKASGFKTICENSLGGSFADQKICKQCPHRYSREAPFTALNVDVRNHHNLIDSLEQFVKGDLLEGANAYHCERCNKKVDTVKRLCIKKLPKVLAIQLKRFEYDWERDCAVKFNDYFEFPREFNLEPFTVEGLAKLEGEVIEDDVTEEQLASGKISDIYSDSKDKSTIYKLMGVVVHSGQASGGHYYSYIIPRTNDGTHKWYRFDDGDVCECNMDNDEELKHQCFGGDYMGEAFDHMLKRRQKRWWSAYLLFYERVDILNEKTTKRDTLSPHGPAEMPLSIRCSVQKENLSFLHTKTQFSTEYFQFIRKLTLSSLMQQGTSQKTSDPVREDLCLMSFQLLCKFLFAVGFHTKKNIRGPANEWYEAVSALIRQGPSLRRWFVVDVLLDNPDRIIEYLLECPVGEIRTAFARIIVVLAHITRTDGPVSIETIPIHLAPWQVVGLDMHKSTLSDYLLRTVLEILHREGPDSMTRHLLQYFHLFVMYAGIGIPERKQLLDLGVLTTLIRLAIEDDRGNSTKYQYAELTKLYTLVSVLIRSCDVSKYMKSAHEEQVPAANPFIDSQVTKPIMEIPADVEGLIYTSNYVKRLLEDGSTSDDTIHLIKFLSWECFNFSLIALSEVLLQISYAYAHEIRPFLDILLHMLVMTDSWQEQRLKCAFKGVSDDREGLFDTIHRSKNHNHKRGYQCIKAIVQLTQNSELAFNFLMQHEDLKEKWKSAVRWLGDELERRAPSAYNYNNWSPPTQSNETSNGYFLERSHSARFTYKKACEMFHDEQDDEEEEDNSELMETLNQSAAPMSGENSTLEKEGGEENDTKANDAKERPTCSVYENSDKKSEDTEIMKFNNDTTTSSGVDVSAFDSEKAVLLD